MKCFLKSMCLGGTIKAIGITLKSMDDQKVKSNLHSSLGYEIIKLRQVTPPSAFSNSLIGVIRTSKPSSVRV